MRTGTEIVWRLRGKTPETIPMARLAEYMQQLAALLGQQADVRFVRVEKGSLNLHAKTVGGGNAGRVAARIEAVRHRRAPNDAMRAYNRINEMVYEDGGPAHLSGPAQVLYFPGVKPVEETALRLADYGSVVGRLYALGEGRAGVSARIRPRNGDSYIPCTASLEVGRNLRDHLFESVKVCGRGIWIESASGLWSCESMHIDQVCQIKQGGLREAIDAVRAIQVDWPDDPLHELYELHEVG